MLHPEKTLFDEISDSYPYLDNTEIRSTLAAFLFTGEDVFKRIKDLSGGERGRVSLAKLMLSESNFLILDEPTRGIDVNAKAEIHRKIRKLVQEGMGVIVVSSEMPEIMGLADRIVIMHEGSVTGVLSGEDINETTIIRYATKTFDQEQENKNA